MRADARRSWRTWAVLGLLLGLGAGSVLAAAAGARRTATAYQDLLEETAAIDGALVPACPEDARVCPSAAAYAEEVRSWPGVAGAAAAASILAPVGDEHGTWETQGDACNTGTGEVSAIVPLDDHFGRDTFRLRILEGRDLDPAAPNEAVLAPEAARLHGVEVGDTLLLHLGADVSCEDPATWGERTEVEVVGIGFSGTEVPPKTGFYIQGVHLSPELAGLDAAAANGFVGVRLEPGVTFDELSERAGPPGFILVFARATDLSGDDIEAGLRSDANALWLVAGLGAVAAVFVLGPMLARYRWTAAAVDTTLGAVGWSRSDRVVRSVAHALAISVFAGAAAFGVMLVASTKTPIGDARRIEPHPGIELDAPVFGLGWLALVLLVSGAMAVLALRIRSARSGPRRTPLAAAAARLGLPTRAVLGLRIGLEPGPGQVPLRSSVLALALGMAGVVGVLVYTAGAQHLRETPAWRGVPWDDIVFLNEGVPDGVAFAEGVAEWPEVATSGHVLFFTEPLSLGEGHVAGQVMAFSTGPDAAVPTVVEGRAPINPDEALLNPLLADRLGVTVGDELEATFDFTQHFGPDAGSGPPFPLEVVGTGLVPIGDGRFESGVAMTREGYLDQAAAFPGADEELDGLATRVDFLLIDRSQGVTDAAITDRLAAEGLEYDPDPAAEADFLDNIVSADPTSTEAAPDLLAGLMALMGAAVLVYGLSVTVHRNAHDLAVARALGLTPRLLRSTARWAGLSFAATALVVAVPVGVVVGRSAWRTYAEGLGVIPDPVTPAQEIVATVAAVLLVAGLVGSLAVRWRSRRRAGEALRTE